MLRVSRKRNKVSVDVGMTLASKTPKSKDYFIICVPAINTILYEGPLIKSEFKEAFFSLNSNDSSGFYNCEVRVRHN